MIESKEKKTKDVFIAEIVNVINDIPAVYLKTLYALIHSFKENIPNTYLIEHNSFQNKKLDDDVFDWDNLINEIHANRQKSNILINSKINQLLSE